MLKLVHLTAEAANLIVEIVHLILHLKEVIFVLVLCLEFEALRPLRQTRVVLIEDLFVELAPLNVRGPSQTQRAREVLWHFEV